MQRDKNIDSAVALEDDKKIIKNKKFLHNLYIDFYKELTPRKIPSGPVVELGSGGGFLKEKIPKLITSDVIKAPGIDKVFFAEKMPFKKNSVAAYVMIDVLHHIKDVEKAFKEMERTLKVGGKIIMIEPYNSFFGGLIYKYLHYEHYDPFVKSWKIKGKGRMSESNTALPWIIFARDRKIFEKKFPDLKIIKARPHTPIRYLISGGLTKPQFLPSFTYNLVKKVEELLSSISNVTGMFITIELVKNK